ncbi:MAG: DNA-binding response regulator [Oscillatoriales cyanobacterium]|nr:MAG: DNA-binding response regulator [Oscillatoriales cyanobacterium]
MKKVLIVDDEPNILILMEQALEKLEDEDDVEEEKPDLVFLDVMMPKMSGLEVCNTVKNELGMEDIYIIMLTAKGQEYDKQSGMAVGANLYMTKPFRPKEVLVKAREILGLTIVLGFWSLVPPPKNGYNPPQDCRGEPQILDASSCSQILCAASKSKI